MVDEPHRLVAGLLQRGERALDTGTCELARGDHQPHVVQAREHGQLLQTLKGLADAGQVSVQIEPGGVEQIVVVFFGLHVLAVDVLVGDVVRGAVARPLQLLVPHLFHHRADRGEQMRMGVHVRLQFEEGSPRDLGQTLIVVHGLAIADAAVAREPEHVEKSHRHAVGLPQLHRVHDPLHPLGVSRRAAARGHRFFIHWFHPSVSPIDVSPVSIGGTASRPPQHCSRKHPRRCRFAPPRPPVRRRS